MAAEVPAGRCAAARWAAEPICRGWRDSDGSAAGGVSSTYEEARALAEWARTNGVRSVIVPTEIFSSRRVRWMLDKELRSIGTRVEVQALPSLEYDIDNWWQHEAGAAKWLHA